MTIYNKDNPLRVGDTVTVNGTDLKITCAFLEGAFSDDVTIICPEALFHRLMGAEDYNLVGVQLNADVSIMTEPSRDEKMVLVPGCFLSETGGCYVIRIDRLSAGGGTDRRRQP